MQAIRLIVETDEQGRILDLPRLSPRTRHEAIFLELDEARHSAGRQPPPDIAGKGRILGDIIAAVTEPDDWDVLQ